MLNVATRWRLERLRPTRRHGRAVGAFLLCAVAAALVALPVALERAVEHARFHDELGTFPVEVGLCHDGRSTLDTGIFGTVYWSQTGAFGFGAYARATGPPEAGGTLASYVDPAFIQANVAFVDKPRTTVDAYGSELSAALRRHLLRDELLAAVLGGALILAVVPRRWDGVSRKRRAVASTGLVVAATLGSVVVALQMFDAWDCSSASGEEYTIPGVQHLAFGSPETREIAAQVKPFIEKNERRIRQAGQDYQDAAVRSFDSALAGRADLAPRTGEVVVLAEADPQGSFVGTRTRTQMYEALRTALGPDAIALRTIAGDVTSNGTVAESTFVAEEAAVADGIPVAAAAGDHDSTKTWSQMTDESIEVPDLDTVDVDGLRVSGANDREHKTLFGGLVTNSSGVDEAELGAKLRKAVDDQSRIVLLHQPDAVAGYLGLPDLGTVRSLTGSLTTPYDDGIEDQPPGIVDIGHLHETDGPWVLWNTDGDQVTWTVVDQLGTAGGVENAPTFSRFSTPFSAPLKPLSVRLQYVNHETGLETGYVTVTCTVDGACTISPRTDVGLPGGRPGDVTSLMGAGQESGTTSRPASRAGSASSSIPVT